MFVGKISVSYKIIGKGGKRKVILFVKRAFQKNLLKHK